jgi:hypothetical protein
MPNLLDRAMGKLARPGQLSGPVFAPTPIEARAVLGRSETVLEGGRRVSGMIRDASDAFAREAGDEFSWHDPETWEYPPQGVSSSNLVSVAYDGPHKLMQVTFTSGAVYNYRTVPESEYSALMRAPSKGRYHYHRIRCSFPYEEITKLANNRGCGSSRGRRNLAMNRPGQTHRQRWSNP